jgi:hypothetical protein
LPSNYDRLASLRGGQDRIGSRPIRLEEGGDVVRVQVVVFVGLVDVDITALDVHPAVVAPPGREVPRFHQPQRLIQRDVKLPGHLGKSQ